MTRKYKLQHTRALEQSSGVFRIVLECVVINHAVVYIYMYVYILKRRKKQQQRRSA